MKTINEIYKEIKQLRDSLEEYIKTNDTSAAKVVLISNLKIYNDILNQLEESGILEENKEIEELKTRISELEDKDWYEACIKQLEEQNDKLIKERDEIQKELETSVNYWKNEVFKKIEVKLTGVTKEKIQEIRKQVCDEIREKCVYTAGTKQICPNTSISTYNLNEILDQIEKEKNNDNYI